MSLGTTLCVVPVIISYFSFGIAIFPGNDCVDDMWNEWKSAEHNYIIVHPDKGYKCQVVGS